jgi:prophage antirepressor-like protein
MIDKTYAFHKSEFGALNLIAFEGKAYFPAADSAKMLGCTNPYKTIHSRCRRAIERKVEVQCGIHADGTPAMQIVRKKFIPVHDLCYLIALSHLPNIEEFKGWVFDEILPSIGAGDGDSEAAVEAAVEVKEDAPDLEERVSDNTEDARATGLRVFSNEKFGQVRTVTRDGAPWFIAVDACRALGIRNSRQALSRLDDDEKGKIRGVSNPDTNGKKRDFSTVNEAGLYSLILTSRKPGAKEFKRWIVREVIPSIRKHGAYITREKLLEVARDPREYAKLLNTLADEQDARKALETTVIQQTELIGEMTPKAEFCDTVLDAPQTVSITLIAKDYGLSGAEMNKLLRAVGIQYQVSGTWVLYKQYAGEGYTQTKTRMVHPKDAEPIAVTDTAWTQAGRMFIYKALKRFDILPLAEAERLNKTL